MKQLNAREKLILFLTLGLVVFFIIFEFIVKPMHEGSVDINDQLRVDRSSLINARHMLGQKVIVDSRYQDLVDLVGVVDSEESQMPMIVSKIETAARETNIHIANIQPQKPITGKDTMFLGVELEIDGQWLDIVRFLFMLQQKPNIFFINELNLEKYSDMTNSLRGRIVVSRMCLVSP